MNVNRDPDSILNAWLDEGPTDLPDATRRAILTSLPTTPQERRGRFAPRRFSLMNSTTRLATAAIAAVVVIGGAIYLIGHRPGVGTPSPTPTPTAATQARVSPSPASTTGRPVSTISVLHDGGLVFAFGSLWIGDQAGVQRIDPSTDQSTMLATTGTIQRLWSTDKTIAVSTDAGELSIDPGTNAVTAAGPEGMPAFNSNWAIDSNGTLLRFDPTTDKQTGSVSVEGTVDWQPQLVAAFGSIWIGVGDTHQVVRVDPTRMTIVARIGGLSTDSSLLTIGSGFGSIWAQANAAGQSGILYRIDPATNKVVATIPVGDPAHSTGYGGTVIAFSDNAVWTADSSPTVTRVDPATNKVVVVGPIQLPAAEWIAFGSGSLWMRNQTLGEVQRYDAAAWGAP
jgi:hypothetical protein